MKDITIHGRTLQYQRYDASDFYYGEAWTSFYEGTETVTYKKYWLFGKVITEVKPKWLFTLRLDIESPEYTKTQISYKILNKLELLKREDEIKRGEII